MEVINKAAEIVCSGVTFSDGEELPSTGAFMDDLLLLCSSIKVVTSKLTKFEELMDWSRMKLKKLEVTDRV